METHNHDNISTTPRGSFFYGWIIVGASVLLLMMSAGVHYSFGVFFKPLAAEFHSSRVAISGIYSAVLVTNGIFAVPVGWLADKIGPAKLLVFCGIMTGLGLILTSQVTSLWQVYLTYGLIIGIAVSGPFPISTATTVRWFVARRGVALGIVSAGLGLGTLVILPISERLITTMGWSKAYFVLGVAALVIMVSCSVFLRRDPEGMGYRPYGLNRLPKLSDPKQYAKTSHMVLGADTTLRSAIRAKALWILLCAYFLFSFCLQIVMVHLVSYATDRGISAFMAATFVSAIGASSVVGRLVMGTASDIIGSSNALLVCCIVLMMSLLWLIFATGPLIFYLFAVIFGFAYGGEMPQIAPLIARFFGLKAMTALVGAVVGGTAVGGALGSWAAGKVFDMEQSYQVALIIAASASFVAVIFAVVLRKMYPSTANDKDG